MNILLTQAQADDLDLETNREFLLAAFYTGHNIIYIKELLSSYAYYQERVTIVSLAYKLGLSEADTIEIK